MKRDKPDSDYVLLDGDPVVTPEWAEQLVSAIVDPPCLQLASNFTYARGKQGVGTLCPII